MPQIPKIIYDFHLRGEVTKAITSLKAMFSSAAIIPLLVLNKQTIAHFVLPLSPQHQVLDATMGSGTTEVSALMFFPHFVSCSYL